VNLGVLLGSGYGVTMSLDAKVSALTGELKSEFWKAWKQIAVPAEWKAFTTIVPSTTRIENYINGTPVPALSLWRGTRNYGQVDTFVSQVRNEVYHTEISAKLEDIEDDQTGILKMSPPFMAEKAKIFPGRMVVKLLGQAMGSSIALASGTIGNLNAFDGLPYFSNRTTSTSGAFGSGNNLITYSSQSNDQKVYNLVALFTGNGILKPVAWQDRSGPDFQTNSGTPQSYESRLVRWWVDLRGAPFFTYFWNAVGVNIIGTPNVAEMHAIFSQILTAFRTFQYPKSLSTEDGEYVHEQTVFNSGNLYLIGSTYLSEQLRQSVSQDWMPQSVGSSTVATTNNWKGFANWNVSRFLDTF